MEVLDNHYSVDGINKTSLHIFHDAEALIKKASDGVVDAKNIGSNRSKGFASIIVVVASLVLNACIFFGYKFLAPERAKAEVTAISGKSLSPSDLTVLENNLTRVAESADAIASTKTRVAPNLPIEQNLAAIRAAASDIRAVVGLPKKLPAAQ